jgi:hypothetical protein
MFVLSFSSQTKRTLRMLYNEHVKAGRELERRITKLREENKDPTLPQKVSLAQMRAEHSSPAPSGGSHPPHPAPSPPLPSSASLRLMDSQNNVDESFMVLGQRVRLIPLNALFLTAADLSCPYRESLIQGMLSTTSGESWKECWTIFLNLSPSPQPLSEQNQGNGGCNEMVAQKARLSVKNHLFPGSPGNSGLMAS